MTGSSLTETEVLQHQATDDIAATSALQEMQTEPRTLSFAELKAMIESGDTANIPNNHKIPDALNVCNIELSRYSYP